MKKIVFSLFVFLSVISCSIQQMAYNSIAPLPEQKQKAAAKQKSKNAGNPILAFTGESDVQLVADSFPVLLKTVEMLHFNDPSHRGVSIMTGQLYVMYANAFVERSAKHMSDDDYEAKHAELMRAKKFYVRGADYVLQALELEYPGLKRKLFSFDEVEVIEAVQKLRVHDVEAIFFGASGILGAFSLDPMDADILEKVNAARLMLERACELNPSYSDGALWEVLTSFYAAAPDSFGGGMEKAKAAYEKALAYSKGQSASTYLTYATAFCVPAQDGKGFDKALKQALAIDPDANPETRLMTTLSQIDARWMQKHRSEFIY